MSKQKYVEIPIPAGDYDELTEEIKKLGFKSVDEFIEKATREYLEKLKCEVEAS